MNDELWDQCAALLQSQLAQATWNTWFRGVDLVSFDGTELVLGVPSSVACERIRSSYSGLISDVARDVAGRDVSVTFVVQTAPRPDDAITATDLPAPAPTPTAAASPNRAPQSSALKPDTAAARAEVPMWMPGTLNPRYTFDNFVIGTSNRFAHAAALSVAEAPARSYNPLFIYGPAGLGKTHLLHAIGHHVQAMFKAKRVRYVSTETFMNEFVDAIRTNSTPAFKRRYREVDVLLIDDIQFLERSQQLQEEFFHTFNSLHGADSQIVISSDRSPKSIATLEDRLRSRFEWGLITDIQPPEFETRLAILRKKADAERLEGIPPEVLDFIATHISDNVRELEGALIRVAAYSSLHREPLNEEIARHVLADLVPPQTPRQITPQLILEETAKMFGWTIDDLCGASRRRPLVTARQIGMYVFRDLTDYSYPRIAEVFGGRDHTTVMHAVEKIKSQMTERQAIFEQVNELIARIKLGNPGG
ncbi:MAG: chromosomal replication initiator protein DnaA [Acidimicrobiia bacterium]